jgi:hypothetical protein
VPLLIVALALFVLWRLLGGLLMGAALLGLLRN